MPESTEEPVHRKSWESVVVKETEKGGTAPGRRFDARLEGADGLVGQPHQAGEDLEGQHLLALLHILELVLAKSLATANRQIKGHDIEALG